MVDEPYQSSGYGLLMWKAVMASINKDSNMAGDVTEEKIPMYQRIGLQPKWCVQCIDLVASQAALILLSLKFHPLQNSQFSQPLKLILTTFWSMILMSMCFHIKHFWRSGYLLPTAMLLWLLVMMEGW